MIHKTTEKQKIPGQSQCYCEHYVLAGPDQQFATQRLADRALSRDWRVPKPIVHAVPCLHRVQHRGIPMEDGPPNARANRPDELCGTKSWTVPKLDNQEINTMTSGALES